MYMRVMNNRIADGSGNGTKQVSTVVDSDSEAPLLSQDNVFAALSSKRCRYILTYLQMVESPTDISTLVETVAEWETGKPIDLVSEEHCKRVLTSLRHAHLPKLSMIGLLEYDEAENVVESGPYTDQVETYLKIAAERDENVDAE